MTLQFKGITNDLLYVHEDGTIKCTRLVNIDETTDPEKDEVLDVCLTSSAPDGKHNIFDAFLDKEITITICTND